MKVKKSPPIEVFIWKRIVLHEVNSAPFTFISVACSKEEAIEQILCKISRNEIREVVRASLMKINPSPLRKGDALLLEKAEQLMYDPGWR